MSDERALDIPGTTDDPADIAYADDGENMSYIPEMSVDHSSIVDDAVEPSDGLSPYELTETDPSEHEAIQRRAVARLSLASDEPQRYASLLASELHEQINLLLTLHRNIHDGLVLATEQVQDKRIEWLEIGPEVSASEVLIEFALTFFLGSPLLGRALKSAFRFAARTDRALVSARVSITRSRLQSASQRIRQEFDLKIGPIRNQLGLTERQLVQNQLEIASLKSVMVTVKDPDHRSEIARNLRRLEDERRRISRTSSQLRSRERALLDQDTAARLRLSRQPQNKQVTDEEIQKFFEQMKTDYAEAALQGAKSAHATASQQRDSTISQADGAPGADSIGVQLLGMAQDYLRKIEHYLSGVAANVHFLSLSAQNNRSIAVDCVTALWEIQDILLDMPAGQRERGSQTTGNLTAKQAAALEFEKLIWALLLAGRYEYPREPDPWDINFREAIQHAFMVGAPPPRVIDYWRDRFFSGQKSNQETLDEMQKVRTGFLRHGHANLLTILSDIRYRKELLTAPGSKKDGT
jgi:hypothetical protein